MAALFGEPPTFTDEWRVSTERMAAIALLAGQKSGMVHAIDPDRAVKSSGKFAPAVVEL